MKKLQLKDLHPETARGFRFLMVPSELIENGEYADLDDSAKLLYSKMIERAGWSACNEEKFSDKSGRLFIIYTVEQMKKDLQKSQPTIVKLTKQLEDKGLIEKVRQGQGKPTRIYIKDFSSAPHHEPEKPGSKDRELSEVKNLNFRGSGDLTPEGKDSGKSDDFTSINEDPEPSEVKDVNFLKLNSLTSRSKDSLLPEVKNLNAVPLTACWSAYSFTSVAQAVSASTLSRMPAISSSVRRGGSSKSYRASARFASARSLHSAFALQNRHHSPQ